MSEQIKETGFERRADELVGVHVDHEPEMQENKIEGMNKLAGFTVDYTGDDVCLTEDNRNMKGFNVDYEEEPNIPSFTEGMYKEAVQGTTAMVKEHFNCGKNPLGRGRGGAASYYEIVTNDYIESQVIATTPIVGEHQAACLRETIKQKIMKVLNLQNEEEIPVMIDSNVIKQVETPEPGVLEKVPLFMPENKMDGEPDQPADSEDAERVLSGNTTGEEPKKVYAHDDTAPKTVPLVLRDNDDFSSTMEGQNAYSELMTGKPLDQLSLPEVQRPELSEEDIEKLHQEVETYCTPEQMASATFSELMSSKRSFTRTIDELDKNYFQLMRIQQLKNLYPNNPLCKSMPDYFTKDGQEKYNIDEFMKDYAADREKLVYSIELIDKALSNFEGVANKASFLTKEMSNSLAKKIKVVENAEDMPAEEKVKLIKHLENSKAAYDDRVNLSYLKEKINVNNPKFTKDINKMLKVPKYDDLIANAIDILDGIFTPDHINVVEEFLRENYCIWNGPAIIINYMARGLKSSISAGNHIWFKLFFMNIIDMCISEHGNGEFDLPGGVEAAKKSIDEIVVQFQVIANKGREVR